MRFSIVAALSAFVFLQSSFAAPTTTIPRAPSDLTADQLVQALQADVHLATDLQNTIESLNDESSEEDATAVNQVNCLSIYLYCSKANTLYNSGNPRSLFFHQSGLEWLCY